MVWGFFYLLSVVFSHDFNQFFSCCLMSVILFLLVFHLFFILFSVVFNVAFSCFDLAFVLFLNLTLISPCFLLLLCLCKNWLTHWFIENVASVHDKHITAHGYLMLCLILCRFTYVCTQPQKNRPANTNCRVLPASVPVLVCLLWSRLHVDFHDYS